MFHEMLSDIVLKLLGDRGQVSASDIEAEIKRRAAVSGLNRPGFAGGSNS